MGKRFWPEKTIYLSTFDLAIRRGGDVKASEVVESQGREAFPVFLDVRGLGRERMYLIAVLRDS